MQRVLTESQSLIFKVRGPVVVFMAAKHAIFFRDPHDSLDTRQSFDVINRDRRSVADEIDLRQSLLGALLAVYPQLNVRQPSKV
jgi:hypothetical protein